MAGEHGKDRELDFAYWANLGGSQSLTVEEAEGLMGLARVSSIPNWPGRSRGVGMRSHAERKPLSRRMLARLW